MIPTAIKDMEIWKKSKYFEIIYLRVKIRSNGKATLVLRG